MAEAFEFEVRPIEGAMAVVGEEVTFRSEDGKLYALNEDGEAFGVVPKAVAARLEAAGTDSLEAEVMSRAGGVPTVSVMGLGAESAAAGAAGAATVAAAAAGAVSAKESAAKKQQPVEQQPVEPTEPVEQPQPVEQPPEANQRPVEQQPVAVPQPEQPSQSTSQPAAAQQSAGSTQTVATAQYAAPAQPAASAYDASTVGQSDQGGKKPKGKYIVIGVVAAVVVLFVICVVMMFAGSGSDDMQTVSDGTISLKVPADWEVEEDDGSYVINSTDHDAVVTFVSDDILDGSLTADEVCEAVASGVNSDDDSYLDEADGEETVTSEGAIIRTYDYEYVYDGEEYEGEVEIILSGASFSVVAAVGTDEYEDDIEDVIDSVTVLDPSEPDLLDADAADEVVVDENEEDSAEGASSSTSELLDPEILESGYYIDEYGYVYYAVCWQNPNEGYAIEYPELTITGRDANGAVTFVDSEYMDYILPGEVQYFAGLGGGESSTVSVEFSVAQVDDYSFIETTETAEDWYTISNTNVIDDGYGDVVFTGEITTDVELEDVTEAWVSVILRDEDGNIMYGSHTIVDLAAEGESAAFEIDTYDLYDYATYEIYAIPW